MFGFLRRKRPVPADSSPTPDDPASSGASTAQPEAARVGIGMPTQSLYPAEMLYPAEVLRPSEKPESTATVDEGPPVEGPQADALAEGPRPAEEPSNAAPPHAGEPSTAPRPYDEESETEPPPVRESATEPPRRAGDPAAEPPTHAPASANEPRPEAGESSTGAAAPAATGEWSTGAAPAAEPSSGLPAREGFYGSLYSQDVLARPQAIVLPSGDAVVTLPEEERRNWVNRLRDGMSRTRGNLAGLFSNVQVDDALFEDLESALIASDAGVATTQWLMQRLQERVRRERLVDPEQVRLALRALLVELLMPLEKPMDIDAAEPLVMMIAGVNGAGKTTSIGKLAHHLQREGKSILLAAGDTFRAAAREQLAEWGSRNRVDVISQQGGDPAAVAFDAVQAGRARRSGVVIIDTAGRLPTQTHLMEELRKIRRVAGKAMDGAPHETLLVLDGNTGQNMLAQVKAFDEAVPLSGLVVTKLDGTAKGGALAALAFTRRERPIPVYFIGVGEKIDDLQAFSAEEFAAALLG